MRYELVLKPGHTSCTEDCMGYGTERRLDASGMLLQALVVVGLIGGLAAWMMWGQGVQGRETGPVAVNCSVPVLQPYFGAAAPTASCICMKESSGRDGAINSAGEFSVGRFQINLFDQVNAEKYLDSGLPRAEELAVILAEHGAETCAEAVNGVKPDLLQPCVEHFSDAENNLEYAAWLQRKSGWEPWVRAASMCGVR